VQELAIVLGTLSGLRFVAPELATSVMIVTALGIQITHAIICRIFAVQRGRPGTPWFFAGLAVGVLAVLALLVLDEREARAP
jgi:hypothetical protein